MWEVGREFLRLESGVGLERARSGPRTDTSFLGRPFPGYSSSFPPCLPSLCLPGWWSLVGSRNTPFKHALDRRSTVPLLVVAPVLCTRKGQVCCS